jgi:D-alanyl-D-alanine carboxypeptidase
MRTVSAEANTRDRATTPIKPNTVKTFTVKAASLPALSPFQDHRRIVPPANGKAAQGTNVTNVATVKAEAPAPAAADVPLPPPPAAKPGVLGVLPAKVASAGDNMPMREAPVAAPAAKHHGGWIIQVGAFDEEAEAKQRLSAAKSQAKTILGSADPFTEKVVKGARTLFRARFAGLDKEQAEAACKNLRHGEIPCMLLKN